MNPRERASASEDKGAVGIVGQNIETDISFDGTVFRLSLVYRNQHGGVGSGGFNVSADSPLTSGALAAQASWHSRSATTAGRHLSPLLLSMDGDGPDFDELTE